MYDKQTKTEYKVNLDKFIDKPWCVISCIQSGFLSWCNQSSGHLTKFEV